MRSVQSPLEQFLRRRAVASGNRNPLGQGQAHRRGEPCEATRDGGRMGDDVGREPLTGVEASSCFGVRDEPPAMHSPDIALTAAWFGRQASGGGERGFTPSG